MEANEFPNEVSIQTLRKACGMSADAVREALQKKEVLFLRGRHWYVKTAVLGEVEPEFRGRLEEYWVKKMQP